MSINHYCRCFYRRSDDLLSLLTIDADKTVTVLISHKLEPHAASTSKDKRRSSSALLKESFMFVQPALLYQRRGPAHDPLLNEAHGRDVVVPGAV